MRGAFLCPHATESIMHVVHSCVNVDSALFSSCLGPVNSSKKSRKIIIFGEERLSSGGVQQQREQLWSYQQLFIDSRASGVTFWSPSQFSILIFPLDFLEVFCCVTNRIILHKSLV